MIFESFVGWKLTLEKIRPSYQDWFRNVIFKLACPEVLVRPSIGIFSWCRPGLSAEVSETSRWLQGSALAKVRDKIWSGGW
jgi:hypothetical protein